MIWICCSLMWPGYDGIIVRTNSWYACVQRRSRCIWKCRTVSLILPRCSASLIANAMHRGTIACWFAFSGDVIASLIWMLVNALGLFRIM